MDPINVDKILEIVGMKVLDSNYTELIGCKMYDILPLIVSKTYNLDKEDSDVYHQKKCIALAKLQRFSREVHR